MTVTNSTLSGNSANNFGGGVALELDTSMFVITNTTITGNSAGDGGGIWNNSDYYPGTVLIRNTISAKNSATTSPDVNGHVISQGHNLIGDGTGGDGYDLTDLVGTADSPIDPMLGPLQDNGGPTQTMALMPGSRAIDAGDNTDASEWDQRGPGYPRIVNGIIDIGAFEVQQSVAPTISCSVADSLLWPPNNRLVNVGLSVDVQPPDAMVQVQVYANDNANAADAANIGPGTLELRAARHGHGSGRVYLIVVTASAGGQTAFDVCTVVVPHDQSADSIAKVQGAAADAEAYYREFQTAPAGYALLGEGPSGADANGRPNATDSVVGLRPAVSTSQGLPAVLASTVTVTAPSTAPVSLAVQPDHPAPAETVPAVLPLVDARHAQDAVFAGWDGVTDGLALNWT
jgi:hypothetical protein